MSTVTYPVRLEHWTRPVMEVCPECHGHGYNTIEVKEAYTAGGPDYPMTYDVTCYKTRRCWRCQGEGMMREDR